MLGNKISHLCSECSFHKIESQEYQENSTHTEGLEKIKGVKLSKVSQIGIVVPDIGTAVSYYSKFLNIKPWFRGESFPLELDIVLAFSGGIEIELIQMLTDRECIYSDIMKKQLPVRILAIPFS